MNTLEIEQKVRDLYRENLNRDGEADGVSYYTALVTNGVTLSDVDHMMEASPEYATLHGGASPGVLGGNGRALLLVGALGLVVWLVMRRKK